MTRRVPPEPPANAAITRVPHVVSFYETDAMGIVHHSNYVRFFEHGRVAFLIEHDKPYTAYMEDGLHWPVTRAEAVYVRPCRFADQIEVSCWIAWARSASLGFAYRLSVGGQLVTHGSTDHAVIDARGVPKRLPESFRARLAALMGD